MRLLVIRRTIQLLAIGLLLLPVLRPLNSVWFGTYLSSQILGFALTDPLAALEVMLAGKAIWWPLIWSVIPLVVLAMLLGRVFCGWVCPLNTAVELVDAIKAPRVGSTENGWWPYRLLAMFLLVAVTLDLPLFTILSPIGVISRAIAFGAGFEILLVLMLLTVEGFYGRKTYCRCLCPVGALYGLLGKWRLLTVSIDQSACRNCGKCHEACTMRVKVGNIQGLDHLTCTNCGDCIDACPGKTVYFTWKTKQKGGAKQSESVDGITG